jgi:ferric-dicitrate binding protein FerR (iron transport regulator)
MNTVPDFNTDIRSDEALEALFAKAAARPLPPAEREQYIREQVYASWQQHVTRRRQQRRQTFMAIAASIVIAAVAGMLWYQPQLAPVGAGPIAMVEKRFGDVRISDAAGVPYYPAAGRFAVSTGQSISTGNNAGMAMTWSNGGSLRLDEYTTVAVTSANEIYLQRGRVYFDSTPEVSGIDAPLSPNTGVLTIRTDHGLVTPLGTRYVTQEMNNKLMVLVRQGEVSVRGANFSEVAREGQRMLVTDDTAPSVVPVAAYGDEWGWIEKTTPIWNTEDKTIFEFLNWVSRESGRPVRFDSLPAEQLAKSASLVGYGQVDLEPSVALRIVLLSTDLDWTIRDGVVVISRKSPGAIGEPN